MKDTEKTPESTEEKEEELLDFGSDTEEVPEDEKTQEDVNKALGIEPDEQPEDTEEKPSETVVESKEESEETPEEKPEQESEEETKEEEEEETKEVPEQKEDDEEKTYKERYADSQREFQTKYRPMEIEFEETKSKLNETTSTVEQLSKEREELRAVFQSNPELFNQFVAAANQTGVGETARKAGVDEEIIQKKLDEALAPFKSIVEENKQQKVKKQYEAIEAFEKEHPGLEEGDRKRIGGMAAYLQASEGLEYKQSMDRAFVALFPERVTQAEKDAVEKQAKLKAMSQKEATTSKSASAGSSAKATEVLSAQERFVAKRLGMSEADYVAYKKQINN